MPTPAARNLYTNNSGSDLTVGTNAVSVANINSFALTDFGLTGASGEPTLTDLINWARGVDLLNEDGNILTTVRNAMGDPLHSQPAAVVYGGTTQSPDVVVIQPPTTATCTPSMARRVRSSGHSFQSSCCPT